MSDQTEPAIPIFVTGVPRCGSSWVGQVLARASERRYIYEPFNSHWVPGLGGGIGHFRYIPANGTPGKRFRLAQERAFAGQQSARQWLRAARRGYLGQAMRSRRKGLLVKDPTAVLMTAWLEHHTHARVLLISRHPCGFASSLVNLGWNFPVRRLLDQQRLMHDHLSAYESILKSAANDPWENHGAFWGAVHYVLNRQLENHPAWIIRRYEDLCLSPEDGFKQLLQPLAIEPKAPLDLGSQAVRRRDKSDPGSIRRDSAAMAHAWQDKLSPGQVDAVLGAARAFETGVFQPE